MNGEGFPGFDGGERADGGVPEGLVAGTVEPVPGGAENITNTVEPVPGGAEDITDTVEPVPAGEEVAEGPFVIEESPAAPVANTPADWARRTFKGFAGSEKYKAMSVPNEEEGVVSEQGDVLEVNPNETIDPNEAGIEDNAREREPQLDQEERRELVDCALEDVPTEEELISCLPLLRRVGLGIKELKTVLEERGVEPVNYLSNFLNMGFSQEDVLDIFTEGTILKNLDWFTGAGFLIETIVNKVGSCNFIENIEKFRSLDDVALLDLDIAGIAYQYLEEISDKKVVDKNLRTWNRSKAMARKFFSVKPVLDALLEEKQSPALSDERIISACFRGYYDFEKEQFLTAKNAGCDPKKLFERYAEIIRKDSADERGIPASFWVKNFGLQEEDVISRLGQRGIQETYEQDHEGNYLWLLNLLAGRSD